MIDEFRSDDFVKSVPVYSFFFSLFSFLQFLFECVYICNSLGYSRTRVSYTFDSKQASRTCFTRIPSSFSSAVELSSSLHIQYVASWDADHVK